MKIPTRHRISSYTQQAVKGLPRVFMLMSVALLSAAGCSRERHVAYADFVDIPSSGWSAREYCGFDTSDADSALFRDPAGRYDMMLTIRHTGECPYAELYLPAVQSVDSCTALPDTLHVCLTGPDGRWRGTHSKGIYTVTDTLLRSTPLPPLYSLRLYHAMPADRLGGLLSVGLVIEESD